MRWAGERGKEEKEEKEGKEERDGEEEECRWEGRWSMCGCMWWMKR